MARIKSTGLDDRQPRTPSKEIIGLFDEFMESGFECAEVLDIQSKLVLNKSSALRHSAKYYGYPIEVFARKGTVYLKRII